MDCRRVGELIRNLRIQKGMTQRRVAEMLGVSDKAISKWERGLGCPDVSLLNDLSHILGVNVESILAGDLNLNELAGGNMRKIGFYVCENCNNVITALSGAEIACCGRKLSPLTLTDSDNDYKASVSEVENDYYVVMEHEMTKEHYIGFLAYVSFDRVLLIKLFPEQNAEARFPRMQMGRIYAYCNAHGLREISMA